jgi:UDP-glucose:(heptosyl)LPS alpha-1,3-glucosyltransferase
VARHASEALAYHSVNIAFVVHHYDLSEGTGGYTVELISRIARHHEVTLYAASVRAPVPEGVHVVHVPALQGRTYATILSFPAAFSAVRRSHDLVHAQGWVTGRAHVVTAHIVLRAWRRAARRAGIRSPAGERLFGGFVERREARLYRAVREVIAPSAKIKEELARDYGRQRRVTVVRHGFPAPSSAPARDLARRAIGVPMDAFVALYIGDPRKGLVTALRALRNVDRAHLLVVSRSAPDQFADATQQLGVGQRVHWVGPMPDPTVAYAAADVLVHPTIYDSFGLVVAEAMAESVPPIVTRWAGISELIEHGESGWIVQEDDVVAGVAAALEKLSHDPELRQRLASGARDRSRRRTWDEVARETLAVYGRIAR